MVSRKEGDGRWKQEEEAQSWEFETRWMTLNVSSVFLSPLLASWDSSASPEAKGKRSRYD